MLTSSVIAAFGGNLSAAARAAGVSRQAVQQWGAVVPYQTALHLHRQHKLELRKEDYVGAEKVRRDRIRRAMLSISAASRKRTLKDRASTAE
jgi:hypothetical protein